MAVLYARMSGCMLLVLGFFGTSLFAGLAWYGIDAGAFVWPWLAVGGVGLILLVAGARRTFLVGAALIGAGSTAFWTWAWATSVGFDGRMFALLIAISGLATATALGGWIVKRIEN